MSICHLALGNGYPYLRILLDGKSTQSPPPLHWRIFYCGNEGRRNDGRRDFPEIWTFI